MTVQDILQQAERDVQKPSAQKIKYAPTGGIVGRLNGNADAPAPRQQAATNAPAIDKSGKRKSGYARDLHPDLLDAAEKAGLAAPPASDTGAQIGRVPPALIRPKAHYEAVDADEAMSRAKKRLDGALPAISGGLDDPKVIDPKQTAPDQYGNKAMEVLDSPDVVSVGQPVTRHTQERLVRPMPESEPIPPYVQSEPNPYSAYFEQRKRISFVMPNGTYAVPAIDVQVDDNGVIILLPCGSNDATFIPNAGSKFAVKYDGQTVDCFFPGTVFTLSPLNVTVLTMLKDTKQDA